MTTRKPTFKKPVKRKSIIQKEIEEAYRLAKEQEIVAAKELKLEQKEIEEDYRIAIEQSQVEKRERKRLRRPAGFVPKEIPFSLIDTFSVSTEKQIQLLFSSIISELQTINVDAIPRIAINQDGSVDAEIRILVDAKPADLRRLLTELEGMITPIPQTWISIGMWLPPGPDEHKTGILVSRKTGLPLKGGKGSYMVQSHYYGAWDTTRVMVTGKGMLRKLTEHNVRSVESVVFRINWNPKAKVPTRLG